MSSDSRQRIAYLVVGFPRSGTSAISHFLSNCGIDFGDPLHFLDTQVHRHNPIFFELDWVNRVNDRIIEALGSRFKETFLPLEEDYLRADLDPLREELTESIRQEWPDGLRIGIKDPRFCFTLPMWREALTRLGYAVRIVWALRSPAATIESNCKLQPLWPKTRMSSFWVNSMLACRYFTRDDNVTYLDYDRLMSEPAAFAKQALAALSLEVPDPVATVLHVTEENHHQRESGPSGVELVDRIDEFLRAGTLTADTYAAYRDVVLLIDDDEYVRRLEATLADERRETQAFVSQQTTHIEKLTGEVGKLNRELESQQTASAANASSQNNHIEKLTGNLKSLHQVLETQRTESQAFVSVKDEHIGKLTDELRTATQTVLALQETLQSREALHIAVLEEQNHQFSQERTGFAEQIESQRTAIEKLMAQLQEQYATSLEYAALKDAHIDKLNRQLQQQREAMVANIAAKDGHISELSREIGVRDEKLCEADGRIHALQREARSLQEQIGDLTRDALAVRILQQRKLDALQNELTTLTGRKMVRAALRVHGMLDHWKKAG